MTSAAKKMEPSKIVIAAINKEKLALLHDEVVPLLDKALAHSNGELDREMILQDVRNGDWLLLAATRDKEILGICIGYIVQFQTGKRVISVPITSGAKIVLWLDQMMEAWKNLAPYYDCVEVYGSGRKGWGRMLDRFGVETIHTTYRLVV